MILLVIFAFSCSDDDTVAPDGGVADVGTGPDAGAVDGATTDGSSDGAASSSLTLTIKSGRIKGKMVGKARGFFGIPFAAPPTGNNRFKAPQPVTAWSGVRDATTYGPSCVQETIGGMGLPGKLSEDCLYLNVFAPDTDKTPVTKARPVMVWIHGGGFTSGGAVMPIYNGGAMAAATDTVVVTINYRLGALGFLAHGSVEGGATNAGILDQRAALTWVKNNIAAFGGDPANVTIFGESAGALSVCTHLVSPGSKGLFHRAIMQSGACMMTNPTLAAAQKQGQDLANKVGCGTVKAVEACLRSKKATDLIKALPTKKAFLFGNGVTWSPVVDNKVLLGQPYTQLVKGSFNKVPVMIGTNADEGTLFVFLAMMSKMTETQYKATLALLVPGKQNDIAAQYPVTAYKATSFFSAPSLALSDVVADMAFNCLSRMTARALAGHKQKVYRYFFSAKPATDTLAFLGAYHSAEIPFVFGSRAAMNAQEKTLSKAMTGYWTRFAAAGDPNSTGATTWPTHDATAGKHLDLGYTIKAGAQLKKAKCDFWTKLLTGK